MNFDSDYQNTDQEPDMQILIAKQRLLIGTETIEKGEEFTISKRKAPLLISESMAEPVKTKKAKVTNQ